MADATSYNCGNIDRTFGRTALGDHWSIARIMVRDRKTMGGTLVADRNIAAACTAMWKADWQAHAVRSLTREDPVVGRSSMAMPLREGVYEGPGIRWLRGW